MTIWVNHTENSQLLKVNYSLKNLKKEGIHISFQIEDFKDFYEKIKSLEFKNKKGEIIDFYDNAKNLSMTDSKTAAFEKENIKMFALDEFAKELSKFIPENRIKCSKCRLTESFYRCKCKSLQPTSTDGLYINLIDGYYPELYFIEFKNFNIYNPENISGDKIEILDDYINKINDFVKEDCDEDFKENLKKIFEQSKTRFKVEYKLKTMLKAFESLVSILPNLYEYYCHENKIEPKTKEFMAFLINCKKEYIIFYNHEGDNISQFKAFTKSVFHCQNNVYDLQRLRIYPFDEINFFDLEEELITYITAK